ncbi:hypothetical protein DPEC_G00279830 [Dallia pectoralis]|uniref:Uncharacterized protein n=1 Tax=Dallia pectoralis TaxID=75939 RepID=A0ACC2FMF7_DALPE|nr:hypothetical protein DPEC_G00279830 [Dallia pectoralis]
MSVHTHISRWSPCGQSAARPSVSSGAHGVNPAPSITSFQRRADRPGTRPPRTGGWWFSCPPRLLQPCAPIDTTPTAGLAISARPRPEGPIAAQRQQLPAHFSAPRHLCSSTPARPCHVDPQRHRPLG